MAFLATIGSYFGVRTDSHQNITTVLMTIYVAHVVVTTAKCEKLKIFIFGLIPEVAADF